MAKAALEAKSTRPQGLGSERAEALIAKRAQELFDRLPPLLGFSFDETLSGVDVELQRWPGHAWSDDVYGDIEALIIEFASELAAAHPHGGERLRGRTFARHFH